MSDVMKLAIQITAVDMLSGIVSRMKQSILGLGEAGKKVQKDFDDMTSHISTGLKAIAVSSYALTKIRPGIRVAGDLQEAMINVRMNLMEAGKSAKDLDSELAQVRGTAIEISKVAPFSAQDVVEIQNTLLKAGLQMKDVIGKGGAAWAATALATITGEAPQVIGESLVSIASPFNIKGSGYGEVADFLQKVDTASVTSVPELVEGLKYVAGTAANMKISLQDTATAMGAMSQQGLRGTMAGTSLNQFFLRLNAITPMSRKAMQHMGLSFYDLNGKLKPLPVIIEQLREKFGKLSDQKKMFFLEKIFDTEGARAALALMHEGEGSWEAVTGSIRKGVSLQDKMNTRLTGFNANLKALASTAKTTLATLFDPMLKPLTKVLATLNDIVFKVGEFHEKNKEFAAIETGAVGAVAVGAGALGLYHILKGGAAGARVLKGLGGMKGILSNLGGTAAGVAEGKVVQAATGVAPVFITNWPANFGGGAVDAAAAAAGAGGILGNMKRVLTTSGMTVAAAGYGTSALMAIGVAAAGYALGSGANWLLNKIPDSWSGGKAKTWGEVIYDKTHSQSERDRQRDELLRELYTARQKHDKAAEKKIANEIKIFLNVDQNGRMTAKTEGMNNKIDLPRGDFRK